MRNDLTIGLRPRWWELPRLAGLVTLKFGTGQRSWWRTVAVTGLSCACWLRPGSVAISRPVPTVPSSCVHTNAARGSSLRE